MSGFVPRSEKEINETIELIDSFEMQCALQRNIALNSGDMEVAWMMENQRVNFAICRQAILWTLNLTKKPVFDAESVAEFFSMGGESE